MQSPIPIFFVQFSYKFRTFFCTIQYPEITNFGPEFYFLTLSVNLIFSNDMCVYEICKEAALPSRFRSYCFQLSARFESGPRLGQADLNMGLGRCRKDLLTRFATGFLRRIGYECQYNTINCILSMQIPFCSCCSPVKRE